MILVTLGTQDKSFKRLLEQIEKEVKEKKIKDRVVVQAGHTVFESEYMEIKKLIPMEEFENLVNEADILITHGGVGSIISGLNHNKKVIASARLKKYHEHTNDHQLQIIESFTKEGYILNLDNFDNVSDAIKAAEKFEPKQYQSNRDNMVELVEQYIKSDQKALCNKRRKVLFDEKTKKMLSTSFVFLFFYIIFYLAPITGDDFGNYLNGSSGVFKSISYAIRYYQTWEGRFFSRIFINILTYNKMIWNLLNALCMTGIYHFGLKMIRNKNYLFPLFLLLGILLVDEQSFRQGYIWLAGNITYLFPTAYLIMIVYLCLTLERQKKYIHYILPISAFIFSMFVENVSIAIALAFLLFNIFYYLRNKKINKVYLCSFILSFLGTVFVIFAPGNMNRLDEHEAFKSMDIISKIQYNLPNFISYTFIRNSFFLILIGILIIYLSRKYIKNRYLKVLTYLYLIPLPITAIINYVKTLNINVSKLLFFLNGKNILIQLYYIGIIFIVFVLLFNYYKEYKKEYASFVLFLCGMISNASMFLSPIWGGRTALPTTLMLTLSFLIILGTLINKQKKLINISLFICVIVVMSFFLAGYYRVYQANKLREYHIKLQLNEEKDKIKIDVLSERFLWNPNPWNKDGYLAKTIKLYYNIDLDKDIEVVHEY